MRLPARLIHHMVSVPLIVLPTLACGRHHLVVGKALSILPGQSHALLQPKALAACLIRLNHTALSKLQRSMSFNLNALS